MSKHRARPWRHVAGTFLNTGVYLTFCQRADTRREPRRAQVGARRHPLRRPPAARAPLRRSHGAPRPRHKARPRRGAVRSPQPAGGRRGGRPEVSGPCRRGGTGGREVGCSACRPPGVCRAWAVEGKGGVRSPGWSSDTTSPANSRSGYTALHMWELPKPLLVFCLPLRQLDLMGNRERRERKGSRPPACVQRAKHAAGLRGNPEGPQSGQKVFLFFCFVLLNTLLF